MEFVFPVLIVLAMILAMLSWFGSFSLDQDRIRGDLESRGGRVVSINWAPFGKGWFGEKNDRIYEVVYYDREGNQRWATCKTSFWSGVFWSEDRVAYRKTPWQGDPPPRNAPGDPLIRYLPPQDDLETTTADERQRLDAEIAQLRQRLANLEQRRATLK
jgi:hypothetical protein